MNKFKKAEAAPEPAPEAPAAPTQEELLAEIRDLLKTNAAASEEVKAQVDKLAQK